MKIQRTPIASAVALLLVGVIVPGHAQQAATPAAPAASAAAPAASASAPAGRAPQQLDSVVITGIRGSLETAVNIKRNSTAIVDAVSAEDVGKLPDSDVGEALGRIPGVSVGRDFGQGASVSIGKSAMAQTMLWAMLLMGLAFWMYAIAVSLARVRNIILEREAQTEWVRHAMA